MFSALSRVLMFAMILSLVGAVCMSASAEEAGTLKFSKRCLMLSPNEGCAIADVNQDGAIDIVAGTHWFAGPDFVARPLRDIAEVQDVYLSSNGDQLYDVDGDGWLDVISIGWFDPELCWYRNPGEGDLIRGKRWEKQILKSTRGQNEAMALHDLDGDGVPEIFVNSWDKKAPVVAWKLAKNSEGNATVQQLVIGADGSGHGFGFGDINGDGREDVLCEAGWYERPTGDAFAKPWKLHSEAALPHPSCPCIITDLNGDGRNDIIWGKAHDFGLYWSEQEPPKPDGTTNWKRHLIDDTWSQPHCLAWTDLTGDGQPELITGKRVRAHCGNDPGGKDPAVLFYYTWDREAGKFTRHTIGAPGEGIGTGMQIAVGDLNADGHADIAVSGKSGTYVLINKG
jgi:hypothetical protein